MADDGAEAREELPEDPVPGGRSSRMRPIFRNTLRAALGLTLGLVIAEVAFRARDGGAFPHLNIYVADDARGVRLRPAATEKVSFSKNPITSVRINDEGYRGGAWPPPAADEVVVVGDSQVFGLGVEESETFSAVLAGVLGGDRVVRNLGVPTYGPDEYNAALDEALTRRPAKTVIYTVNLANDLFEANHPNRERHAVWDGWAVRKETAPASVVRFPGRSFLYSDSHAFYALRRFLYDRGPKVEERGFESEGTWKDIGGAASSAEKEHTAADQENDRLARLRETELRYAADGVAVTQTAVEDHVVATAYDKLSASERPDYDSAGWLPNVDVYRAAKLSPGDIVQVDSGESSRDVRVTAEQIRRGAALRLQIEKDVRKRAEAKKDDKTLGLFAKRDAMEQKEATLKSAPLARVVALSPLAPALRAAKAICDKHGARLLVVALPIDVQVSKAEWAKYGAAPIDMEGSKVLLDDVVVAARAAGADGFDATPALAAAEPGAFLDGDIHMTPKGHRALGEAIAKALRAPKLDVPGGGLPADRSAPPEGKEWRPGTDIVVKESDPAGCETKRVREWLGVFCRNKSKAHGVANDVKVTRGLEVSAGSLPGSPGSAGSPGSPGSALLVAPLVPGQDIAATFAYEGATRELTVHVPVAKDAPPTIAFTTPLPAAQGTAGQPRPLSTPVAETAAFCKCFEAATPGAKCATAGAVADSDCARTYASDCTKLLACAAGQPFAAPKCGPGQANAGAAQRCRALCSAAVPCANGGRCAEWQGGHACM
jgi:SGNH hydrolase-like domain, acetyltransferase AlgX